MFKRLIPALAGLLALAGIANAAGTVPGFSLTPQFDLTGKVMPGCKLFVIQTGTVSTPQQPYQDSGLSILAPNPLLCDASGRIPQFFLADGTIKLRLQNSVGVQIFIGDNLLVLGASGGGGGGGTVDPTTILATGDIKVNYGTGILSGFVRANGRTIGSSTSGATERANADCQALFQYLWGADPNLAVSGGRGVSGAADWAANKTITLPDGRGRVFAGLDDMGNSAASRLTATYFGTAATVLGAAGGGQNQTFAQANLPNVNFIVAAGQGVSGSVTITSRAAGTGGAGTTGLGLTGNAVETLTGTFGGSVTSTGTAASGGSGTPLPIVQPTLLVTTYIKL